MPGYPVPSGRGHAEIRLDRNERKPVKSVHVYQTEEALNVDFEFEDESLLEMIFRVGFSASVKLLENRKGDYVIRRRIKPKTLQK